MAKKRDTQSLIGKTFYFCDSWEWDDDEEPLLDEDGEILYEICGDWKITSADANKDGDVWACIEIQDRDFQIELPISFLPESVWWD